MQLLFLGTGAGVPAKQRNVSSIALRRLNNEGAIWLFDCGEATQHQILHTTIKPRRIEKIFITHLHGDHIYGLPGLLGSRSFQGGTDPLTVYGPKGIKAFIQSALQLSATYVKYDLSIIEIEDGTVIEESDCFIHIGKLDHGIDSFGYRVVEKDRTGELQVHKLKELGVKPGPIYKQLKDKQTVQWEGMTLNGADFLGEDKKGLIVTILGDTRLCRRSFELAEGADLLVHEATFEQKSEEMAYEYFHSTTAQAATVAKESGVKELWLTHISSRYTSVDSEDLVNEARAIFENSYIAHDFSETAVLSKEENS
ncbi:ribonuclease Z [Jeotgalibacillus proteolyticus]|uniref:Ribonuclease Z n=1 Tax=Jeotgalibacillus proteolyticus TaxID=2082395 RepID=A0A2S5GEJ9_9BACL|nr:ribonuclease Z [Jeotgalibacillus proteolyticus]PPA71335.1 ribonuclease Z [Jeotgalibacillus proteolyticus]